MQQSDTVKSSAVRRALVVSSLAIACAFAVASVSVARRVSARVSAIDELLRFSSCSIKASFQGYRYTGPLHSTSTLTVFDFGVTVIHRGDRYVRSFFSVQDKPSKILAWLIKFLGENGEKGFSEVTHVYIGDERFNDADLSKLYRFPQLHELRLPGTHVTDTGLQSLRTLVQLTVVDLSDTNITDDGLERLDALVNLRDFDVMGTAVSQKAILRFEEQHPNCNVYH